MLEQYLIPLAPYLLTAAGMAACLCIFCSLKQELAVLRARLRRHDGDIARSSRRVLDELEEIRAQLREAEERTAQLVPPPPVRSGLNIHTRTQAIRLFRRGEEDREIALKLGLPLYEVRLLLKVHNLAVNGPAAGDPRQSDTEGPFTSLQAAS